jgi:hypothetical protein
MRSSKRLRKNIAEGKSPRFTEDNQGVLWYKGRICVPDVNKIKTQYSEKLIILHTPFAPEAIRCIKISRFPTGGTE